MIYPHLFNSMDEVADHIQRQLKGLGSCTTHDNLRSIAFGLTADEGRVVESIAILLDSQCHVLSWGILYWDDYGLYNGQGIQLYTRASHRRQGYGTQVYNALNEQRIDQSNKPIISLFKDNISFWKKVGVVPKHVHHSMQRSRP